MKISKFLLLSIVIGGLATSCEKAYVLPEPIVPEDPTIPVVPISFANDIQPIFNANCVACHPGSSDPDLTSGLSYAALNGGGYINTATPASSILYLRMTDSGSPMPTSGVLSTSTTDKVLKWIEQGALNN